MSGRSRRYDLGALINGEVDAEDRRVLLTQVQDMIHSLTALEKTLLRMEKKDAREKRPRLYLVPKG